MFPWGALIGAGASLAGGFLNRAANEDASQAASNARLHESEMQRQFAQAGLRWRASDAMEAYKESGIHPLAMLGVSGPSYSPVNFVGSANNSMGDAISSAGQGFGRAIDAAASQSERLEHAGRLDRLLLERGGLENELLKVRIASEVAQINQVRSPSMPVGNRWLVDGQGESPRVHPGSITGLIKEKMMERTPADPAVSYQEPGAIVDRGYAKTGPNSYIRVPGKDVKERIEDDWLQQTLWFIRNNLLPGVVADRTPPFKAPPGKRWGSNWVGEFSLEDVPVYRHGSSRGH